MQPASNRLNTGDQTNVNSDNDATNSNLLSIALPSDTPPRFWIGAIDLLPHHSGTAIHLKRPSGHELMPLCKKRDYFKWALIKLILRRLTPHVYSDRLLGQKADSGWVLGYVLTINKGPHLKLFHDERDLTHFLLALLIIHLLAPLSAAKPEMRRECYENSASDVCTWLKRNQCSYVNYQRANNQRTRRWNSNFSFRKAGSFNRA